MRSVRIAVYLACGIGGSALVFIVTDACPIRHPTFCDWQFEGGRAVSQMLMIQRGELECDVAGLALWLGVLAVQGFLFGLLENRIREGRWRVSDQQKLPLYLWWVLVFPIIVVGICVAAIAVL